MAAPSNDSWMDALRMSPVDVAEKLLSRYPESSPFDSEPPLENLRPDPVADPQHDTDDLKETSREQVGALGMNPWYWMYGICPLVVEGPRFSDRRQIPGYVKPPPLQEADLGEAIEFLEQIKPNPELKYFFKVRVHNEIRLLKVFPAKEVHIDHKSPPIWPSKLYEREKAAYEHLLHHGICDKGIVPRCFGFVNLAHKYMRALSKTRGVPFPREVRSWARLKDTPRALLLEYFEGAEGISADNISFDIADTALRHLRDIHTAFVEHGDIAGRNVLVLPDGRVVWVDFDSARCGDKKVWRKSLLDELAYGWGLFYSSYLPDQRINFHHWLY